MAILGGILFLGYILILVDAVEVEKATSVCHPPKKGYEMRSRIVEYKEMCVYHPILGYGEVYRKYPIGKGSM